MSSILTSKLPASIVACIILGLALLYGYGTSARLARAGHPCGAGVRSRTTYFNTTGGNLLRERNFYGTLRVIDSGSRRIGGSRAVQRIILHGMQFLAPEESRLPTTYYGPQSGGGAGDHVTSNIETTGRRDWSRRGDAGGLRARGRLLPLLRDQSGRDRSGVALFPISYRARPPRTGGCDGRRGGLALEREATAELRRLGCRCLLRRFHSGSLTHDPGLRPLLPSRAARRDPGAAYYESISRSGGRWCKALRRRRRNKLS